MIKFEFLKLNIGTVIIRFYLMMAIVIIGGFTGQWWIAILALPVFLSTMMAVKFNINTPKKKTTRASETQTSYTNTKAV